MIDFASLKDIPDIIELQKRNHIGNFDGDLEKAGQEGFVETLLTPKLAEQMVHSQGIIVSKSEKEELKGLLVAADSKIYHQVPGIEDFLSRVESTPYLGKDIGKYKYLIFSVCTNSDFRKQGVAKNLYTFMFENLNKRFDIAVSEVLNLNIPSYKLHVDKLGANIVDTYTNSLSKEVSLIVLDLQN